MEPRILYFAFWSILNTFNVKSAVPKIDVTVFQPSPFLVDLSSDTDVEIRGYLAWYDRLDKTFNIGREVDTGPGDKGTEIVDPPTETIPSSNLGFPLGSRTAYTSVKDVSKRINLFLEGSEEKSEQIGAFYVTANDDVGNSVKITAIKRAAGATVKFVGSTKTASIGDAIELEVTTNVADHLLRWRHNSVLVESWDGMKSVTIDNVRKADEGIYECYEDGMREQGVHAIMKLIVRACPRSKFGDSCTNDCPTCYHGGMCEESSGICVCPPGFEGEECKDGCGSNNWGATCSIFCSSGGGNCGGKLFCVPDPVGCSCIAGYGGETCATACTGHTYGASCEQTCHCLESDCNNEEGCQSGSLCDDGYGGYQCQVPDNCENGYYGGLCEYKCHCKDDFSCDRVTGTCINYQCAEGWGGDDCQQALPALHRKPSNVEVGGTTVTVTWDAWDQNIDYGTGPADTYQLYYAKLSEALEPFNELSYGTDQEVSGLNYETSYKFAVSVLRDIDSKTYEGFIGPEETVEIGCGVPSDSPTITSVVITGPTSLDVEWTIPTGSDWIKCSTGIEAFHITYGSDFIQVRDSAARTAAIEWLQLCTEYNISISAANKDMTGPASQIVNGFTAPTKVVSLALNSPMPEELQVEWDKPETCRVDSYVISYRLINRDQCEDMDGEMNIRTSTDTNILLQGLESYSTYEVTVAGKLDTVKGENDTGNSITNEKAPSGPPMNVMNVNDTIIDNSVSFSWEPPLCGYRHGSITVYEYVFGEESGSIEDLENLTIAFYGLDFFKEYEFKVRAGTSKGIGPYSEPLMIKTPESSPEAAPQKIESVQTVKKQLTFRWEEPPEDDRNGVINLYDYEFDIYTESTESPTITEWPINSSTNQTEVVFKELPHDTTFKFRVRARTSVGEGPYSDMQFARTPPGPTGPSTALVAGVSVCILFLIIVILILVGTVFLKRRKAGIEQQTEFVERNTKPGAYVAPSNQYQGHTNAAVENDDVPFGETSDEDLKPRAIVKPVPVSTHPKDKPIPLEDFIEYVRIKKIGAPDHELKFDHSSLSSRTQGAVTVSKNPENIKKNRYKNIITYDHARVHLELQEGDPTSDYINASYMNGYQKENAFIAAQGPTKETLGDMWRMILHENTRTIVMLTNLIEGPKRKCNQYWPNRGKNVKYGSIFVTNESEEERETYIIRTFNVVNEDVSDIKREVKQFHFIKWPDMQAPEFAAPILEMLEEINEYNPQDDPDIGPIVVHCSAGVGRTGSILTIDTMLKMARAEGKLDIYNYICQMRTRRTFMVQTDVQYEFIHDALLEALYCLNTTIETEDVERIWSDIAQNDSWVVNQYKAMNAMFPALSDEVCRGATDPDNKAKNRFPDCIPNDSSRPYLMSSSEYGGNNYINAAFCNGYSKDDMYLATQIPLPNTLNDFWCMIYDYKCYTIVALYDTALRDETWGAYLPEEGSSTTFGQFTVEVTSTKQMRNLIKTKLKLTRQNKMKERPLDIVHIQYTDWPAKKELPESSDSFLNLLENVEEGRRETGDQRISSICTNGASRSGLLCALISIIDKIKEEQQVDVFHAVKRLRKARHDMVETQAQYMYCYEMARVYLRSFETYSNFSA